VPDYQRTYAWDSEQLDDFWNDIREAMMTKTEHYWGTLTLRQTDRSEKCEEKDTLFKVFEVVDGQQRITTLYLFLLAISKSKPPIRDNFIKCGNTYRLELGGLNNQFLKDLVDGKDAQPTMKTNRLLKGALRFFENQLAAYTGQSDYCDRISDYLQRATISLEFVVQDETLAVRAFQTLNDRGKQLTLLDKTKSFLMFYSLRYLNNTMAPLINTVFGNVFMNYDLIRGIGEKEEIDYISGKGFSEDEVLRFFYHYFAYYAITKYHLPDAYDYDISAEDVFKQFLKKSCEHLRMDSAQLKDFIEDFLKSFAKFVNAFQRIINNTQKDCQLKKLFSFLRLNARLYPLIISLESEGILDQTLLSIIESVDMRIYKIRGTDPRAGLYRDAISRIKLNPDKTIIDKTIRDFVNSLMWDDNFRSYLGQLLYGNPGLKYALWEFEKNQTPSFDDCDYTFYKDLQIDHIFPEETTLAFPAHGFQDVLDYISNNDKIGNLTLLEEKINKRVRNRPPQNKINEYQNSNVSETKKLSTFISNFGFDKNNIEDRTKKMVDFCVKRW